MGIALEYGDRAKELRTTRHDVSEVLRQGVGEERCAQLIGFLGMIPEGTKVYLVASMAEACEGWARADKLEVLDSFRQRFPKGTRDSKLVPDIDLCISTGSKEVLMRELYSKGVVEIGCELPLVTVDRKDIFVFYLNGEVSIEAKVTTSEARQEFDRTGYSPLLAAGELTLAGDRVYFKSTWGESMRDGYDCPRDERVGGGSIDSFRNQLQALRYGSKALTNYLLSMGEDGRSAYGVNDSYVVKLLRKRMEPFFDDEKGLSWLIQTYDGSGGVAEGGFPHVRWGLYVLERLIDSYAVDFDRAEKIVKESGVCRLYDLDFDEKEGWRCIADYVDKFVENSKTGGDQKLTGIASVLKQRMDFLLNK